MVDVGGKAVTARSATAEARVVLGETAFTAIRDATAAKGDALGTARIAGIMAAKRCAELIPLCHSLPLSFVGVEFELLEDQATVRVQASCRTDNRTGVEMEALTAASVAALTLYDMCKAVNKGIRIEGLRLLEKTGGKSGHWQADPNASREQGASDSTTAASSLHPAPAGSPGTEVTTAQAASAHEAAAQAVRTRPVSVVYFARTAELVGSREETFALQAPVSGREFLALLEQRHPQLAPVARLHMAINQEHVSADALIRPGDEVAVFEPVTGG